MFDWERDLEWSRDHEERERLKASQEQAGKDGKVSTPSLMDTLIDFQRVNEPDDLSNKKRRKPADMS